MSNVTLLIESTADWPSPQSAESDRKDALERWAECEIARWRYLIGSDFVLR